jgi:branched-chain amino acid aminotransferase
MPIKVYKFSAAGLSPLSCAASTLDEFTRRLPEGFYTTFATRARGTKVLGLKDHLSRLYEPAGKLRIRPAVDPVKLREGLASLVKNHLPHESRVRLVLAKKTGELFIGIEPFEPVKPSTYLRGVHAVTSEVTRSDPRIKNSAFITASAGQRKLLNTNVYEVLLTRRGRILEGMTSNFYAVKKRTLITARRGVLLGVTRKAILRLAKGQGMSIEYRPPRIKEKFDEAFLTSSSRGVVPVVSIDGKPVGQGGVGRWAKTLSKAYQAFVEERSESLIGK